MTKTKTPWGRPLPDADTARHAAVSDPRTYLHGTVQRKKFPDFEARYWRQELHQATVTADNGEARTYKAASAVDLNEAVLHAQQSLLAVNRQGRVVRESPKVVWRADILYPGGHTESTDADSEAELLLTLASWVGETRVAEQEPERQPRMTYEELQQDVAVRMFLNSVPEYLPTPANYAKLQEWLDAEGLDLTCENLTRGFDYLNDLGLFDEMEAQ